MGPPWGMRDYDRRRALGLPRQNPHAMYRVQQRTPPQPPPIEPIKSLDAATVFLFDHLTKNADEISHFIQKLRFLRFPMRELLPIWLSRLGRIVFAGQVSPHRVQFRLHDFKDPDRSGRTYAAGVLHARPGPVVIRLNERMIAESSQARHLSRDSDADQILAILLHQMIHAYFLLACGQQRDGREADGRLKHGGNFGVIMYKIKELSGRSGNPLPIGFGHTFQSHHPLRTAFVYQRRSQYSHYQCTDCFSDVESISQEQIDNWYKNTCIKSVDPDIWQFEGYSWTPFATPLSQCGDKRYWVELVHKERTYKLERIHLSKIPSFAKNFEKGKRQVAIPDTVEDKVFASMMHYLRWKRYSPDTSDPSRISKGAPLIQKERDICGGFVDEEGTIARDVKIHKLATSLRFHELRQAVMRRLRDHEDCYENPCYVLSLIYSVDSEKELRGWAKDFMRRYATPKPGCFPTESSNLKKIRDDYRFGEFSSAYHEGLEQLRVDMAVVQKDLDALPAEPLPPPPPPPPQVWTSHVTPAYPITIPPPPPTFYPAAQPVMVQQPGVYGSYPPTARPRHLGLSHDEQEDLLHRFCRMGDWVDSPYRWT